MTHRITAASYTKMALGVYSLIDLILVRCCYSCASPYIHQLARCHLAIGFLVLRLLAMGALCMGGWEFMPHRNEAVHYRQGEHAQWWEDNKL